MHYKHIYLHTPPTSLLQLLLHLGTKQPLVWETFCTNDDITIFPQCVHIGITSQVSKQDLLCFLSFVAAEICDATSCGITSLCCRLIRLNLGFTTLKNSFRNSCSLRNFDTETSVSALCTEGGSEPIQCPHIHSQCAVWYVYSDVQQGILYNTLV